MSRPTLTTPEERFQEMSEWERRRRLKDVQKRLQYLWEVIEVNESDITLAGQVRTSDARGRFSKLELEERELLELGRERNGIGFQISRLDGSQNIP